MVDFDHKICDANILWEWFWLLTILWKETNWAVNSGESDFSKFIYGVENYLLYISLFIFNQYEFDCDGLRLSEVL